MEQWTEHHFSLCEHVEPAGYRICDIYTGMNRGVLSLFSELKHCMRSLIALVAGLTKIMQLCVLIYR